MSLKPRKQIFLQKRDKKRNNILKEKMYLLKTKTKQKQTRKQTKTNKEER